ncbi:MAG TPA: hypothetical protein VES89_06765, partial [Candidatus Competibacteraceae bacterium]|nr:hypothetical protein [Candidatus Competibacteraceae bacterium]
MLFMRLNALLLVIALQVAVDLSPVAAMMDSVFVIIPYRANGIWRFDDPDRAIVKEPFVAGVPAMLEQLTAPLPHAAQGFRWFFSAQPFAGYIHTLTRQRTESQGTWYDSEQFHTEGWLCPVLWGCKPKPQKIPLGVFSPIARQNFPYNDPKGKFLTPTTINSGPNGHKFGCQGIVNGKVYCAG